MSSAALRQRAIIMLLLTTAAWGLSFPGGKALMEAMHLALPGRDSWFFAALVIGGRFGLAAILLWIAHPRALAQLTGSEWRQGIGLGLTAGYGSLIQADGLAYTAASTSAFLTQFTAVLVPLAVMIRDRRAPTARTILCVGLVMLGVAILGQFDYHELRLGRGETETLIAAAFFTALILWLERPIFRGNHTGRVSMVMFGTICLSLLPVAWAHSAAPGDFAVLFSTLPTGILFVVLSAVCSLFAFVMMNRWQPHVDATTAGIVYCAEPLFATVFALFLPAWLAPIFGIAYPNEGFTFHLVVGGTLITGANILIALPSKAHVEK